SIECLDIETDLTCYRSLDVFVGRRPLTDVLGEGDSSCTIESLIDYVYSVAQRKGYWLLSRYCFGVLGKHYPDLADGLTMVAVRHLRVVVGKRRGNSFVIDSVRSNIEIIAGVSETTDSSLERTLLQEFLAIIGSIMRISPRLFDGLRSVQMQNLMMLRADAWEDTNDQDIFLVRRSMSPANLLSKIRKILVSQLKTHVRGISGAYFLNMPESSGGQ